MRFYLLYFLFIFCNSLNLWIKNFFTIFPSPVWRHYIYVITKSHFLNHSSWPIVILSIYRLFLLKQLHELLIYSLLHKSFCFFWVKFITVPTYSPLGWIVWTKSLIIIKKKNSDEPRENKAAQVQTLFPPCYAPLNLFGNKKKKWTVSHSMVTKPLVGWGDTNPTKNKLSREHNPSCISLINFQ